MRNTHSYVRKGMLLVVELDDGVEHAVPDSSLLELAAGKKVVETIRLFDHSPQVISARRIIWALSEADTIDYIETQ